MQENVENANGKASAALLAGSLGMALIGLLTTLSESLSRLRPFLNLDVRVGALSGLSTYAFGVWLLVWLGPGLAWKDKELDFGKVVAGSRILMVLGLLGTFPPFYRLFTGM